MVSFQEKLGRGLKARGVEMTNRLDDTPYAAVLVVGGTRNLAGLWRARSSGVAVVQRLDGMNWLHRVRQTGLRHYLRAEYGNRVLSLIRGTLAERVVYQSRFVLDWWERERGATPVPAKVIHNGVDLDVYTPDGPHQRPQDRYSVLLVEGSLLGGYEVGLEHAALLAQGLSGVSDRPVELTVVGRVAPRLQERWSREAGLPLRWLGLVAPERIPEIDRSAHLLFSADLNAACPNAVIEALACGLPVAAFDTGALAELVTPETGRLTAYGGDPWKLDPPDLQPLVAAAREILEEQGPLRAGARARAEEAFGLDAMVEAYLEVLLG
jgi:glycosyltransferase involved in cell wall biosynthesis